MRYLIGYTADGRGAEAVALAAALGGPDAHLDIAIVLPESTPFSANYPGGDHGYSSILADKVDSWAAEALSLVPVGTSARVVARSVTSPAAGLIAAAEETGADAIVLGGRKRHMAGFFAPGSVTSSLLHASPFPVAMSTPGAVAALEKAEGKLSRITAFVSNGAAARSVVQAAAAFAAEQSLEVRVVSLVIQELAEVGKTRMRESVSRSQEAADAVVADLGVSAEVRVVTGASIDEAIASIDWEDGEIAVVGSSRLARKRRLFLGSTAQRILRTLPVPLLVVPKNYKSAPE